ncbi:MAG TPA: ribonuclease J [Anaerolineales bacterium]|nr:ribonuclease J [Anaerolineales bacterium]
MKNKDKLRIIPIGGLGEVGKNMMAYEYHDQILVVDAGLMFPDNDMLGVDYIIPDFQYLRDNVDRVQGIVITHGHEDHIGAIQHLLPVVPAPVYATPLTRGLIEVKLARNGLAGKVQLRTIQAGETFQVGPFQVEAFHVCHSIPDAIGVGITTPAGLVVHTGDYKFDQTPVDNWPTDFAKLAEFSARGVAILLGDSTNAERPGWTPSERVIGPALDEVFRNAPGRIIIATFASLIARMQQVADAAVRHNRKLAFVGMSMVDNAKIAQNLGYLDIPEKTLVSLDEALHLPNKDVVLMCTGSQGEPSSIIGRLSTGTNRQFDVEEADTIVISSHPIPGNEEDINKTINRLMRRGAEVVNEAVSAVHVSGHASSEEQKLLLNLVRPKFLMPIHGELHQLRRHAALGRQVGIPAENIVVVENGQVVELCNGKLTLGERMPGGYVFVEGDSVGEIDLDVMREREQLARSGIVLITVPLDKYSNRLIKDPEIITRGFISPEDAETLIPMVRKKVIDVVNGSGLDDEKTITDMVRSLLRDKTGRRPMVFVAVTKA